MEICKNDKNILKKNMNQIYILFKKNAKPECNHQTSFVCAGPSTYTRHLIIECKSLNQLI
jgi:hypothetical protein